MQTEPPKPKPTHMTPLTPNSTPPWKSLNANSFSQSGNTCDSPTKDFRLTRQKLVFDDADYSPKMPKLLFTTQSTSSPIKIGMKVNNE